MLAVTSDRGLAGAYSANALQEAEHVVRDVRARGLEPVLYVIGKKGVAYFRFRGVDDARVLAGVQRGAGLRTRDGDRPHADRRVRRRGDRRAVVRLHRLPLGVHPARDVQAVPADRARGGHGHGERRRCTPEYLFEPEPEQILDHLLPQYLITKVWAALLESAASENAARRRAMKAATDNADDLLKVLTRQANRARQDEITTEIMEIVGGAEALAAAGKEG